MKINETSHDNEQCVCIYVYIYIARSNFSNRHVVVS